MFNDISYMVPVNILVTVSGSQNPEGRFLLQANGCLYAKFQGNYLTLVYGSIFVTK